MAFKKIPPVVRLSRGSAISTSIVEKTQADGVTRSKLVHKSLETAYPDRLDAENFSLDKQLKAGVKLKEVNSVLLAGDVNEVDLPVVSDENDDVEPKETE